MGRIGRRPGHAGQRWRDRRATPCLRADPEGRCAMSITVTRPRKTVAFCTNLALRSAHEDAVAALVAAQQDASKDPRENPPQGVTQAAAAVRDLEAQMRDHTITFVIEGWPRKRWVEFEEAHRPRKDNDTDKALMIDVSALDVVLAQSWTIVQVTAPDGSKDEFATAVLIVNRGVKAAPFSEAASRVIRVSEQTSN